jgi:hypothetical protein
VTDQPLPEPIDTAAKGSPSSATVRFVTGSPTDVEVAAAHSVIVAVLAEQGAQGATLIEPPIDLWRKRGRAMRSTLTAGPGAWRGSDALRGY